MTDTVATPPASSKTAIIDAGRNCWRVERADRFHALQDGEYYRQVRDALLRARDTVFILGWDITGGVDLIPGEDAGDAPRRLDELISFIARRRPELRCYILIWDYALLYTMERDPFSRWRFGWRMPRNVRFGFDDHHPVGGCHHQKVVVIDDNLAFSGGMDLTGHRWDTAAHEPHNPLRITPVGDPYDPYHEVQAMVDGPLAATLGALARDRWRALGIDDLPPLRTSHEDLWPAAVQPDFTQVDVAIARTMPAAGTQPAVRECEALFLDAIAQATRTIYIENQYFTNMTICDALEKRLAEPDGPEVIMVLPKGGDGWLERNTIVQFRDRAFRCLLTADVHNHLRLLYPMASRAGDVPTFVHSKVMIVDDEFVRIGSANTNHRSMGVDTECDLAIEAGGDPSIQSGIRGIRNRLLAEHLGIDAETAAAEIEQAGSLRAVIDAHPDDDHTLVAFDPPGNEVTEPPDAVRMAVDPDEPIGFGETVDQLVPPIDAALGRTPLRIWIVPSAAIVSAVIVASMSSVSFRRHTLRSLRQAIAATRQSRSSETIGVGIFVAAGAALIPLEILVIASGMVFGARRGARVAVTGSLAAAALGYAAGRLIGPDAVGRWVSRGSYRSARQLGAHGITGVAVLRLAGSAVPGACRSRTTWPAPSSAWRLQLPRLAASAQSPDARSYNRAAVTPASRSRRGSPRSLWRSAFARRS
jgi:phospholipase D1/2